MSKKLKGTHTLWDPQPEPKAGSLPDRKWDVYEVWEDLGQGTKRGHPSSGGMAQGLRRLGSVSAQDHSEAEGKARVRWSQEEIDYVEPMKPEDIKKPKRT